MQSSHRHGDKREPGCNNRYNLLFILSSEVTFKDSPPQADGECARNRRLLG